MPNEKQKVGLRLRRNKLLVCQDCIDRFVGCHSQCDSYQAFLKDNNERKEYIRKAKEKNNSLDSVERERVRYATKKSKT